MRKRVIAAILALSMAIPLNGCGKKPDDPVNPLEKADDSSTVTRGEWVSMLAEAFGLDTYEANAPVYSDIKSENALYTAVQSAAEWGILSAFDGNTLDPDKKVKLEEVAVTAALASGFQELESMTAIDFAIEHGIIAGEGELSNFATPEECTEAINAAKTVYLNMEPEEVIIVKPSDRFIDLSSIPADRLKIDGEEISIFGDSYVKPDDGLTYAIVNGEDIQIESGAVYVLPPSEEHPFGIARKIYGTSFPVQEEMQKELGLTYKTKTPTLGDLYNELVVHTTTAAELDKIIWRDGISVSSAIPNNLSVASGEGNRAMLLTDQGETPKAVFLGQEKGYTIGKAFDFSFTSGDYQKTWDGKNSKVLGDTPGAQIFNDSNYIYDQVPSVEDFHGNTDSWTEKLETENKFSAGYQITGNITINAITVKTNIEYHKFDLFGNEIDTPFPESASLQITSDINATLKLEGNMGERVKIATVPIPIAATGLTVSVDLYFYADASGTLQVAAELGSNAKAEWRSLTKLKHSAESYMEAKTEAALNLDFGADLSASLDAIGSVKIMDVGAKVGGELTADAYVGGKCDSEETDGFTTLTYTEAMNIKTSLFAPIASIYVGGPDSLIEQAGISGSWDITSRGKGAKEYELVNEEWTFWTKTVKLDKDGNIVFEEETPLGTGGGPLEGDFSEYAGTYVPYGPMLDYRPSEEIPNVILYPDGTIEGAPRWDTGEESYAAQTPLHISENEDKGAFECVLRGEDIFYDGDTYFDITAEYILYPAGVHSHDQRAENLVNEVRLYYAVFDGGVFDMLYIKAD